MGCWPEYDSAVVKQGNMSNMHSGETDNTDGPRKTCFPSTRDSPQQESYLKGSHTGLFRFIRFMSCNYLKYTFIGLLTCVGSFMHSEV